MGCSKRNRLIFDYWLVSITYPIYDFTLRRLKCLPNLYVVHITNSIWTIKLQNHTRIYYLPLKDVWKRKNIKYHLLVSKSFPFWGRHWFWGGNLWVVVMSRVVSTCCLGSWLAFHSCAANQEPACLLTQLLTMTTTQKFPPLLRAFLIWASFSESSLSGGTKWRDSLFRVNVIRPKIFADFLKYWRGLNFES